MNITLLYFEDCPNWKTADERLGSIVAQRDDLTLTRRRVETPAEAERTGFRGSPTILIDGVDVFAESSAGLGLSCRRYSTPDGFDGAPSTAQLEAVLSTA